MSKKGTKNKLEESAIKRAKANAGIDKFDGDITPPPGSILADHDALHHNNTYGLLPVFYKDELVVCKECGKEEVWTAQNQKWWYEETKANINSTAIHCRECRAKKKEVKASARKVHLEGINNKARKNI